MAKNSFVAEIAFTEIFWPLHWVSLSNLPFRGQKKNFEIYQGKVNHINNQLSKEQKKLHAFSKNVKNSNIIGQTDSNFWKQYQT